TYDHRVWKTGLPVRSAVLKPHAGRLVVGWVTTSESLLLYVFLFNVLDSCCFSIFYKPPWHHPDFITLMLSLIESFPHKTVSIMFHRSPISHSWMSLDDFPDAPYT
ncbi:hypothetical protein BO78DRAFT_304427, partial [Aspergillus sclerotiicarbonarius CBS 121057]